MLILGKQVFERNRLEQKCTVFCILKEHSRTCFLIACLFVFCVNKCCPVPSEINKAYLIHNSSHMFLTKKHGSIIYLKFECIVEYLNDDSGGYKN